MRRAILVLILGGLVGGCGDDRPGVVAVDPSLPPEYSLQWGSRGSAPGQFFQPSEMAMDDTGLLYVIDHQNMRVQVFTGDGTYVREIANDPPRTVYFSNLLNALAIHGSTLYVSDIAPAFYRTLVFSTDGTFLDSWDYFAIHGGLAAAPDGSIFISGYKVISRQSGTIEGPYLWKLDAEGNELTHWPLGLSTITVDPEGHLYGVANKTIDSFPYSSVHEIDAEGNVMMRWGDPSVSSIYDDLAVDSKGNVYVATRPTASIQKWAPNGEFLVSWSDTGPDAPALAWPGGLLLDPRDDLYVTDFGLDRVIKYRQPRP